jgi:hypothetical protein
VSPLPAATTPERLWFIDLSGENVAEQWWPSHGADWLSRLLTAERLRLRPGTLRNVKLNVKRRSDTLTVRSDLDDEVATLLSGELRGRDRMCPGETITFILRVVVGKAASPRASTSPTRTSRANNGNNEAQDASEVLEFDLNVSVRELFELTVAGRSSQFAADGAEVLATETAWVRRETASFLVGVLPRRRELDELTALAVVSQLAGERASLDTVRGVLAVKRFTGRVAAGIRADLSGRVHTLPLIQLQLQEQQQSKSRLFDDARDSDADAATDGNSSQDPATRQWEKLRAVTRGEGTTDLLLG